MKMLLLLKPEEQFNIESILILRHLSKQNSREKKTVKATSNKIISFAEDILVLLILNRKLSN